MGFAPAYASHPMFAGGVDHLHDPPPAKRVIRFVATCELAHAWQPVTRWNGSAAGASLTTTT
jgi:hypothetical protein